MCTVADVLEADWDSCFPDSLLGVEGLQGDLLVLGLADGHFDGLAELRILVLRVGGLLSEGRVTVGYCVDSFWSLKI